MIVVPNMVKLRNWLTENNIKWRDESSCESQSFWICRTHFELNGNRYSVVNGEGTYGGFGILDNINKGLLEIYDFDSEPIGFLSADECIEIIKERLNDILH